MRTVLRIGTVNRFIRFLFLIDGFILLPVFLIRRIPFMAKFPRRIFGIVDRIVYEIENRYKSSVI